MFIPGESGGAAVVKFTLVDRDSVDGSLGNVADWTWTLLRRSCWSTGSIYLVLYFQSQLLFINIFITVSEKYILQIYLDIYLLKSQTLKIFQI